jgi:hypothetical protein
VRAPAAAALAALTIAGCGGSSLSDRDLRGDATQVCNIARVRTNRIAQPSSPAAGIAFLRRGAAVLGPELAALRRLGPPSDLASRYEATLAEFSRGLTLVRSAIGRLGDGGDPVKEFKALQQQLAPVLALENASWRALELPACVKR